MLGGSFGLQLDVVFAPDVADQLKLRLEEIDVLLLALEYFAEEVAGDEVPGAFAVRDRLTQLRHRQLPSRRSHSRTSGTLLPISSLSNSRRGSPPRNRRRLISKSV